MISDSNSFRPSTIGLPINITDDGKALVLGNNAACVCSHYGNITHACWKGDVLEVHCEDGTVQHHVGSQRQFEAYKGETSPHCKYDFERALKDARQERERYLNRDKKNTSEKKSFVSGAVVSSSATKSVGKVLWWIIKKLFKLVFFFMLNSDIDTSSKKKK